MRAASVTAARVAQRPGGDKHLAGASGRARIARNPGSENEAVRACPPPSPPPLSLGACDSTVRPEEPDNPAPDNHVSAEGRSEEGKISLKMPGVDMSLSLPKGAADEARAERDSKLLYPGAILRGMAIVAGPDTDTSSSSEVEIRFSTPDPVDKVAAWYRDPARADGFKLRRAARDGDAWSRQRRSEARRA